MTRPGIALLLIALALPAAALRAQARGRGATKPAAPVKPDSVKLRFGWTAGTTAIVESGMTRLRETNGKRDSSMLAVRYRLLVQPHVDGMVVRSDSFSAPGLPAPAGDTAAMVQRIIEQLGAGSASFVVGADGEFKRLEDAAATKAKFDSAVAPFMREMKDAPPQLRGLMAQMTSPEVLTANASREWNVLVGTWSGADWVIGEVYEAQVEEPIPVMPGVTMPMLYQFSAAGRVACDGAERGPRGCVELRMVVVPDSAGMRTFFKELTSRLAPQMAEQMTQLIGGMRTETEVVVVAEPATLRPHFMSQVQRVEVRAKEGPGAAPTVSTQEKSRWVRYRYVDAAVRPPAPAR